VARRCSGVKCAIAVAVVASFRCPPAILVMNGTSAITLTRMLYLASFERRLTDEVRGSCLGRHIRHSDDRLAANSRN
jgi:hypothetical protein